MASKKGKSDTAQKATSPLNAAELEKAWRDLGVALKEKDKDDVNHAAVQGLAEKIFTSSVLSGSPDACALEVLSVSLLQQSRWTPLVSLLSSHAALVASNTQLAFHYAYALYRDKQHSKSIEELKKRGGGSTEGELHLSAQANYRAGNYAAAAKVYNTNFSQDDDVELQANMLAALVSAGLLDDAKAYMKKLGVLTAPPSFELAYNASCCLIECGDFTAAIGVLRKAQALCREVLEEDGLTPAEIENELAVMLVQEAFILQSISKTAQADGTENDRALAIYTQVLTQHPTDPNVLSIASNNVITLRTGAGRVWDSLKKSSKAVENLDLKDMTLSARQKSAIQLNRALALFHGKQLDKARDLLQALVKEFPANVQQALALSAVLSKDKARAKEADDLLTSWLKSHGESAPTESVQAVNLALAHLALARGDAAAAAGIIGALAASKNGASIANRPALVATQVALYEKAGDIESAHAVIQRAVSHWKVTQDAESSRVFPKLLSGAGAWYNRLGRESDAAALLELLAEQSTSAATGNRAESLARLVLAYRGDEAKAAKFVAQLPALEVAGVDVKQLEAGPAPEQKKKKKVVKAAAAQGGAVEIKDADDDASGDDEDGGDAAPATSASLAKAAQRKALNAKKKSKKRVVRYPKGFDPANPGPMPDPERWLPRWERSNQRKFKRRTGNAIRGAQGSTNPANMPPKEAEASSEAIESKGKMSGAAAAAARKRAGKKR